jgi:hypothetical protein
MKKFLLYLLIGVGVGISIVSGYLLATTKNPQKKHCKMLLRECNDEADKQKKKAIAECFSERSKCLKELKNKSLCRKRARICLYNAFSIAEKKKKKVCPQEYKNCLLTPLPQIK